MTARDASSDVNKLVNVLHLSNPTMAVPTCPSHCLRLCGVQTAQDIVDMKALAVAQVWPVF